MPTLIFPPCGSKEVETSYVRPDRGYFIPTIGDFELAWQPGDLISSPFTNPNLRASSDPGRIRKKEGGTEPLVDWFEIDWEGIELRQKARSKGRKDGDKVPPIINPSDLKAGNPPNEDPEVDYDEYPEDFSP